MNSERTDEIRAACDALNKEWNAISAKMYERAAATGAKGATGEPTNGGPQKGKVQEADFEVVEDEGKN
jgi:hypothetical protein